MVQAKGRGFSFHVLIQSRMSFSRARSEVCAPRRSLWSVSRPNHRSIADPGGVGGSEVQLDAGMGRQPPDDDRRSVSAVVIADQVDVQADRDLLVELGEELAELAGPVARWIEPVTWPVARPGRRTRW